MQTPQPHAEVQITVPAKEESSFLFSGTGEAGVIFVSVMAVISRVLYFRKKFSFDTSDIDEKKSKSQLFRDLQLTIDSLKEERNAALADAREAWTVRTRDAEKIARLETTVRYLTERSDEMRKEMDRMLILIQKYVPPQHQFGGE